MTSPVPNVATRRIKTNGIALNIAEAGSGPLVLLLHGFPESWYSWRHQFEPLARAGYHVVAPDMRGYGASDRPTDIDAYNQVEVARDIAGLVPALGHEHAVVIGHDWGAPTAWMCALAYPELFRAVGGLSVPFSPRAAERPMPAMRRAHHGKFFYQLYFQEPGIAEAAFEADLPTALKRFLVWLCGETDLRTIPAKRPDADLFSGLPNPASLPAWLEQVDLDYYVSQFEQSGLRGPLNYYRNHDLTWALTEHLPQTITQPAFYAAGTRDAVPLMSKDAIAAQPGNVPNLIFDERFPGAGHWTQQEAPEAVNALIQRFLTEVEP